MNECKKVYEKAYLANLKPDDKCEIVMMDPKIQQTIIYKSHGTYSNGPFISATLVSHGEITGNTRDGGGIPQATVRLDSEKELTQTYFPGTTIPSFFFVEKDAKPVNCDRLDKPNKRPRPSRIILSSDGSDDDGDDGDDGDNGDAEKTQSPHKKQKGRPAPLNLDSVHLAAPDPRAANMAQQNGENRMKDPFARQNNSDIGNMFNLSAPENFGDNPKFDEEEAHRWGKQFDGGRTKKRRNTRRRTRKYKSKRKQQTRKKTFRKRK